MNFNQIKTNYPKAYNALQDWISKAIAAPGLLPRNLRDLYDFFDQEGVVINSTFSTMDGNVFYCHVCRPDDRWNTQRVSGSTRTEAEHLAFEKAFEILENQLLDA